MCGDDDIDFFQEVNLQTAHAFTPWVTSFFFFGAITAERFPMPVGQPIVRVGYQNSNFMVLSWQDLYVNINYSSASSTAVHFR